MKKKLFALLLAAVMLLSLAACGQEATLETGSEGSAETEETATGTQVSGTRMFTDSVGREVEVPAQIDKIALSGPMAQITVFALCPDKLVGVSNAWTAEAEEYLDPEYFNMPEIGQLYGGKGELNLETLLESGAQIVIDIGEPKDSVVEDLDILQEQVGIPFVHITATLADMGTTYRMLGDLLGVEEDAEALAVYCEEVYQRALDIVSGVEKADILYITGEEGLNVIAQGSYHAEAIDLLTDNLAVVDDPSSKGTGNEVDLEQIMAWDPDKIVFSPDGAYETVPGSTEWGSLTAIQNGDYYEVPMGPYNWMGFPPSVQRLLGMIWLPKVLYPEAADYDLYEEVARYYDLFYHCELTQAQYDALVANSINR